jgi:EAL domain-containing protein (putative c-di-GMP-specific phosphodiesterase class I)
MEATKRPGLSPAQVAFEATESEALNDGKHPRNILDFCRESGFRVALDDFGSSYYGSSQILGALQAEFVKLDMGPIQKREP